MSRSSHRWEDEPREQTVPSRRLPTRRPPPRDGLRTRRNAELLVVHAWQLAPHSWRDLARPAQAVASLQPAAESRLRQWARDTLPGADPATLAVHGGPLDALLAAGADADLIVVGYSPHERLSRFLHGHIADDLTVLSTCPVAVIPVPAARA